jgi:hypothetical protein
MYARKSLKMDGVHPFSVRLVVALQPSPSQMAGSSWPVAGTAPTCFIARMVPSSPHHSYTPPHRTGCSFWSAGPVDWIGVWIVV